MASTLNTFGGGNYIPDQGGGRSKGQGPLDFLSLISSVGAGTPLGYIGPAVNLLTGLFGKDKVREAPEIDTSALDAMPTTYNINPQLEQSASTFASGREVLKNNMAGAPGLISAVNALQGSRLRSDSEAFGLKENMENKMKADKATMQSRFSMLQNRNDMSEYGYQVRTDDMPGNFLRAGAEQVGAVAQSNLAQRNRSEVDLLIAKLLASAFGGPAERLLKKIQE